MRYNVITHNPNVGGDNIYTINPNENKYIEAAITAVNAVKSLAVDIETTGLNPWTDKIRLVAFYNPLWDWCLVIDCDSTGTDILKYFRLKDKLILAHNIQFEYSFFHRLGIKITRTWDTMVAEMKLLQGSNEGMSLTAVLQRRKIALPEGMDKDVRIDFVKDDFELENKHIIYNASDVVALHELMEEQKRIMHKFNLTFFIQSIHQPLALILTEVKMLGFVHYSDKWNYHADNVEAECNKLTDELNMYIRMRVPWKKINTDYAKALEKKEKGIIRVSARIEKLKDRIRDLEVKEKTHLKSYKTSVESLDKAYVQLEEYTLMQIDVVKGINWGSSKQVLDTLEALGIRPLPKAKSSTTHKIQPSVSTAAREAWLLENPEHSFKEQMEKFHELKNKSHNVKSFGRAWVEKYTNPVTGKVHSSFRQDAATGRLTSGNADEGLFNSQQIPGDNAYRTCFGTDPGYNIATIDYSGAELCFMAALAKDERLIELSQGDMHSYFANKGWKAIYIFRGIEWTIANTISKTQNKHKRTDYKPMTFGTVYGLRDKKAAQTLNVSVKEGQIAIDTIKSEIPKTIKMVEEAAKFALTHGYVIHNTRTNSRRWFSAVIYAKMPGSQEMSFMERANVESAARNTRIQGSQGDMVMEAMVTIWRWINLYKIDAAIMGTVHDEIISRYREDLDWFPKRKQELMERVAAKYMDGFLVLRADLEIGKTWIK